MKFLDSLPVMTLVMMSLLLGLAPFVPQPHVVEKLQMLADGQLTRGIDIFDLLMHGTPWVLLIAKLVRMMQLTIQSK